MGDKCRFIIHKGNIALIELEDKLLFSSPCLHMNILDYIAIHFLSISLFGHH